MKKQIIFKGLRRPLQLVPACFKNGRRGTTFRITKNIEFTKSCHYKLYSDDQYGWNRLFGVHKGIFGVYKNSGCFAWRNNNGMIDIAMLTYINGKRDVDIIKIVPRNKSLQYTILREGPYLQYYIGGQLLGESWIGPNRKWLWGCGLRFKCRAPQTIIVEQKNLD